MLFINYTILLRTLLFIKKMLCEAQKKLLIIYMEQHEELRRGQFTATFTYKKAQQLWEEITTNLNSVPNGQAKDWKKWRKTWQDIKKNAKAKNAAIKRHRNMTGGGPACSSSLSDQETEVLSMIGPMQTDGIGVEETPLEFSFVEQSLPSTETPLQDVIYDIAEMDSEKEKVDQKIVTDTEEKNNGAYQEHNYTLEYPIQKKGKGRPQPPRKISKTARLQTSLALSQKHLASMKEKNDIEAAYYRNKNFIDGLKMRAHLRSERFQNVWWRHLKM
ncbi:uncharacterized protein LOC126881655 [Diabrotica virgifera virgifera]|uniref:Regulatory protein zeste n=1 Tax=Diabrotica virgifera virgifera TaxID=50390 RepID=A0ABM5JVM1_DIAVI|nr:uncharacterized protein LOC126881655 [Diabrotica virgifera virgifera]